MWFLSTSRPCVTLMALGWLLFNVGHGAGSPATCPRWETYSSVLGKVSLVAVSCYVTFQESCFS